MKIGYSWGRRKKGVFINAVEELPDFQSISILR
jgi:hypothetical protein